MTNALTTIDPIRQALAAAKDIPDLKNVRDMAMLAKAWAKSRGLGIDAENDAAEYVLRAERQIGQSLVALTSEGRYGHGSGNAFRVGGQQIDKERFAEAQAQGHVATNESLGIRRNDATNFQLLARLTDEQFEALMSDVKASGTRIAKVNFYRANHQADPGAERPTSEDPNFDAFRKGAMGLLGWVVDDEHLDGYSTVNGLMHLPNDELSLLARLIGSLVNSYQEARSNR